MSLRSPPEAARLGNRIAAMLVPLAVDPSDEPARLAATCAATGRLEARGAWTGIDALLDVVDARRGRRPAPLVAAVGRRRSSPSAGASASGASRT